HDIGIFLDDPQIAVRIRQQAANDVPHETVIASKRFEMAVAQTNQNTIPGADPNRAVAVNDGAGRLAARPVGRVGNDAPAAVGSTCELAILRDRPNGSVLIFTHRLHRAEGQSGSFSFQREGARVNPIEAAASRADPDISFTILQQAGNEWMRNRNVF